MAERGPSKVRDPDMVTSNSVQLKLMAVELLISENWALIPLLDPTREIEMVSD